MIRLLLLRWKRVAALRMDVHIMAADLAPTRTPAQLQPAPGLVSYMLCRRLLETNKMFKKSRKKPTENNKMTDVTRLKLIL